MKKTSIARGLLLQATAAVVLIFALLTYGVSQWLLPTLIDEGMKVQTESMATVLLNSVPQDTSLWQDAKWVDQIGQNNPGIVATIFTKNGTDFERIATTVLKDDGNRAIGTKLDRSSGAYPALLDSKSFTGKTVLFGRDHMATYTPIKQGREIVGAAFVGIDYTKASGMQTHARSIVQLVLFAACIAPLLLVGILWLAIRKNITSRLDDFHRTVMSLSTGTGDLTVRLPETRNDELGAVAASFNKFLSMLHGMFVVFVDEAKSMDEAAIKLSGVVHETHRQVQSQHDVAQQVAAAVEEITVSAHAVSDNTDHAKQSALAAGEITENGVQHIGQLASMLKETEQAVSSMQTSTESFVGDVTNIVSLTNVVQEIAEQTNLLALNAAIEAARAGEQGRGFAVVADEVRKLASRSTDAAKQIHEVMARIDAQSRVVTDSLGKSNATLNKSMSEMDRVVGLLDESNQQVKSVAMDTDQIAAMMREQSSATTSIAQNVEALAQSSEQAALQMDAANTIAEGLERISHSMRDTMGKLNI